MAGSSSSQNSQAKEYIVRVPKLTRKKYHMMRFNADLGTDFFKSWGTCKMERENNLKEYKMEQEIPKFGAGSEFGREQREEARRKRYGINVKRYKSENQPWMLNIGGKGGKRYKGIREGGVAENASWYVFMQGKDGAFEAYPVDEWYNFQPVHRYKALSAEEAEEEFVRRDKIMNFFQVMYEKKFKKDGYDGDDEESKKKGGGSKKSLLLSEMDDWVSDEDEDEGDDEGGMNDSDDGGGKKKKKKKHLRNKQRKQGGKAKKVEDASDNSCEEESDDFNEGAEHDYISSDSSDSDQKNDEVVNKELAGVEEGDALKKLLASDEEDEDEQNKEKQKEEDQEKEDDDKKKKKKKKKSGSDSDGSSNNSMDDNASSKKKKKNADRKKTVNDLKRKVKENPMEMGPQNKKMKLDAPTAANTASASTNDQIEEALRRYLTRKPMTPTELLKQLKKKFDMTSEQLVNIIAAVLKKVNPNKRMIKGKMYLSLKAV